MSNNIVYMILIFTNVIITFAMILSFSALSKIIKQDTDLKEKMFLFSLPIDDNFKILDDVVKNEIAVYALYNFPNTNDLYITKDNIDKMIKDVLKKVLNKLSPVYLNKLKYIYNESNLEDTIYEKVRDGVLQYSIEINGTFRDKK